VTVTDPTNIPSSTLVDDSADDPADDVVPEYDTADGNAPAQAEAPRQRHPFEDLPLEEDGMPSGQDLMNGLRAVVDPEIGYNIVDLGLVYEVTKPERGYAHVLMTLTSMGCPLTEVIHQQCSVILGAMPGVDRVEVEFTFTPPWSTDMIADYVREELRAMGMNV
jgi:metal-sulfur cluster biosynthetic enzyme